MRDASETGMCLEALTRPRHGLGCTLLYSMAEQPGSKPPNRAGKGRTPGSFVAGDPRINRAGRPRAGTAFSERGRERIDPDKVLDLAERVMNDENIPARERLAIVMPVIDRIFVKPVTVIDANVNSSQPEVIDWSRVPLEERRAELARINAMRAKYGAPATGQQPEGATDEDAPADEAARPLHAPEQP